MPTLSRRPARSQCPPARAALRPGRPARRRGGSRRTSRSPLAELGELRREPVQLLGRVEQLPVAQVRPPGQPRAVVHPHRAGLREPLLDAVPARVAQVERVADARVGRAEEQLEEAVVARPLDDDADAAEPVAERAHPLLERGEPPLEAVGRLDREPEAVGDLRRPRAELLLGGQPVLGRVQLDRGELRRRRRTGTRCDRARPGRSPAARTDSPSRRCRRASGSWQRRAGRSGRTRTAARLPTREARARPPRRRRGRSAGRACRRRTPRRSRSAGARRRAGAPPRRSRRRRSRTPPTASPARARASSSEPTRSAPSPYHFAFRVTTMLRRPGSGRKRSGIESHVRRPITTGWPSRDLAEPCHVLRDPPGDAVVAADHAAAREGRDERDPHTATGARIAGWCT